MPASWRELYARGQKLVRLETVVDDLPAALGVTPKRWNEITAACSQRVVAWDVQD